MKTLQKGPQTTPGSRGKHSKSSKKSKGSKKVIEKCNKDPNSNEPPKLILIPNLESLNPEFPSLESPVPSVDFECLTSEKISAALKKIEIQEESEDSEDFVETFLKKAPLEKRKPDVIEWKGLKKIDYQRLETVVEEGQLSSEESTSKPNSLEGSKKAEESDSETELNETTIGDSPSRQKKLWKGLSAIDEQPEPWRPEEDPQRKPQTTEKEDSVKEPASEAEPVDCDSAKKDADEKLPPAKKSAILNSIMELLPIFSNDKFVCSRDAISVEECEDFEGVERDKNGPTSGKTLVSDVKKEATPGRDLEERVVDSAGDSRDVKDKKIRYRMLTDKNLCIQTSSHFINSLLVLSPFTSYREKLVNSKVDGTNPEESDLNGKQLFGNMEAESESSFDFIKGVPAVILATLGLFSVGLGVAWHSYEPPRLIDYILELIPFFHRRRTFVQLFFDELLKLLSSIFG